MLQELKTQVHEVWAVAKSEWPIKSGQSNSGLKEFIEVDAHGNVRAGVRNAVKYAPYVRPKEWFGATTAWQRLVRGRIRIVNKELTRRFLIVIDRTVREAARG